MQRTFSKTPIAFGFLLISGLTALACAVYLLETLLPRPLPWLKFGFSNAIILLFLPVLSWRKLLQIQLGKVIFSHLFLGTLFSPSFAFALAGGLVSVSVMYAGYQLRCFSLVALSIAGAFAHNIAQLLVAYGLFAQSIFLFHLLVPLGIFSIVFGGITGIFSVAVLQRGILERLPENFADSQ